MKTYDTPSFEIEWFTANTTVDVSTTDTDKGNKDTEF